MTQMIHGRQKPLASIMELYNARAVPLTYAQAIAVEVGNVLSNVNLYPEGYVELIIFVQD